MSATDPYPYDGPFAPRRRSGTDQTTERLLKAAAREFMDRGYEAARVSSIARRAGLTPGAVYARWPNKSDVVLAALGYIFEQVLPARRAEAFSGDATGAEALGDVLRSCLRVDDDERDVMAQVFSSARNNEDIRESLRQYLHGRGQEICDMVDDGKDAGRIDPELDTVAVSLLCQAVGIGVALLMSAGLDERHVPTEDEWNALVMRHVSAAAPPDGATR